MKPENFITDRMFIGVEAEGKHRGVTTLFIPVNVRTALAAVTDIIIANEVGRVLFGAGKTYGMTREHCWLANKLYGAQHAALTAHHPYLTRLSFAVEVLEFQEEVPYFVEQILVIPISKNFPSLSSVKVENDMMCMVLDGKDGVVTSVKDKAYNTDKPVGTLWE